MIPTLEDLTANQNWTLIGIVAGVATPVVGLLVWLVKWLCGRFATSLDGCNDTMGKVGTSIDNATLTHSKLVTRVEDLHASHKDLKESIDTLPQRWADELRRQKLVS